MTAPLSFRRAARAGVVAAVVGLFVPAAGGYIHFPPPTLEKMCGISRQIRAIKVGRVSPDGDVVLFELEESLKGGKALCEFGKHVLRGDPAAIKPLRDALTPGARAVMFWIEGKNQENGTLGCGYVFLDRQCYSVDYNVAGNHWVFIRPEPGLSKCYHGSAEQLRGLVRDVLAGKKVEVPVKADRPETKAEWEKRYKEVNDVLNTNRKPPG